jgi:citrate synthase
LQDATAGWVSKPLVVNPCTWVKGSLACQNRKLFGFDTFPIEFGRKQNELSNKQRCEGISHGGILSESTQPGDTQQGANPIDGPAFSPDRLTVRGKDLNDLVGSLSYPAAIYHLLSGELPRAATSQQLSVWLLHALRCLTPDQPLAQLAIQSARMGATNTGAVLAALALGDALGLPPTLDTAPLDALGLGAYREGLYYFAIAPLLHAYALEADDPEEISRRLTLLADADLDYVEAIYVVVCGQRLPNLAARSIFDAVMVAFHAGIGNVAPTIVLPRGAISTRASTAMALAAGYTAAGPAHVGACKVVMAQFAEMVATAPDASPDALAEHTRTMLAGLLAGGKRIAGFGHPLFRQDPRNPHLRDFVKAQGVTSPYLIVYDTVAARMHEHRAIHPNIDAIAAALFLTLEFAPDYGTALFLCARMAAMVAHIEEARREPPFGARSGVKRAAIENG